MDVLDQARFCDALMVRISTRLQARMDTEVKKSTENAIYQAEHPNTNKWVPTDPHVLARSPHAAGIPRLSGMSDYEIKGQIKELRRELKALERLLELGEW